ncbi:MAG: cytochrome b N-terminal domain-containing protein [Thermoguttaceae bacterium]|jgi:ubiquinol-cytochrome c reductase cytochrome b subunit
MNSLLHWLNDRIGLTDGLRHLADTPLPGGACWCRTLPAAILFAFCIQAISGFFLWTYYSAGTQNAWESVYYLQYNIAGGWLLRAIHHYAGQMLLALVGLYLFQSIIRGWYRPPREAVYWTALLMCLCVLALLLTGDLLAWSQNSYAATQVRTRFLLLLPGVGQSLYKIAIGGPEFGQLTLTRFLALHIALFAGGFFLLLLLNRICTRRANAAALIGPTSVGATVKLSPQQLPTGATETVAPQNTEPYWPGQAWRNAVAGLIVLGAVLILSLQHGASGDHAGVAIGSPADLDPANYYAAARPEWAFRGLYEFSQLFPGEKAIVPIFIVPGLILVFFLLVPFIGRIRIGHYFNIAMTLVLLSGLVFLSYRSFAKDAADLYQQNALAQQRWQADRTIQLVRAKGIPATGALTLLRNDELTQTRNVFKQQCAICHNALDQNGLGIMALEPSAPNLYGFASRDWIAGLLDPKTIVGPDYYGGTKLRKGDMPNFVKENLGSKLDEEEKKNLQKVIIALSAEAQLPSQQKIDAQDAGIIEEGRKLLVEDFSCTDCHKFHDKGKLGDAPELTGYGSAQWTAAMIGDPKSKRFFGKNNDRMLSYAETSDPAKNILSQQSIRFLSDWLRGQPFESETKK